MKKPQDLVDAFEFVSAEMLEMFIKKHKDYGKGNILDTRELGIAFRVSDKLNRLKHLLINSKNPVNESIEETWVDIGVYAIIAVMLRRHWFKKLELREKNV
ncbi:hypothetical protein COU88_02790 [Candidatus Roizmanbacteria bacterium CG10_big_fil_rev_8_21_14_0_10_39_6]|uniref:Nucleotide modification associated domain-containing protein n=1 Tax=Candidatus Roizmanbacteria bacterium CG10_big_fil_rev_8_21_14_0_10_39_6 TaxID=1974853 RepID=A0A2M8KSD2_9BACT|nr:MAG: hypothetical protein COU88_02790 [Candidatus Roizmanbacteria bacterium CG10_big_fil_rev_8_21_14_0_10_39_6]